MQRLIKLPSRYEEALHPSPPRPKTGLPPQVIEESSLRQYKQAPKI